MFKFQFNRSVFVHFCRFALIGLYGYPELCSGNLSELWLNSWMAGWLDVIAHWGLDFNIVAFDLLNKSRGVRQLVASTGLWRGSHPLGKHQASTEQSELANTV